MQMEEAQLQKRKKQTSNTELPEDIIHDEILIRLPLKSLLRFKCVCKPWRTLFSDPEFTKLHLSLHCCDQNYLVSSMNTHKHTLELRIISRSKETLLDTTLSIKSRLLGSINGLICFARPDVFTLWNPTIRQYKELSIAHLHGSISCMCKERSYWLSRKDFNGKCRHLYGFGWDPTRNDYKMVVVCYVRPHVRHSFVYSCNSDSWTEVVLPTSIFGTKSGSFIKTPCPTIIVKECPYWSYSKYVRVPGKRYSRRYTVVFKFVAEKNEFRLLPDFALAGQQELKLINLKNCLAGMAYKNRFIDIYSLDHEGSAGVWSKMYTLGVTDFGSRLTRVYRKLGQFHSYDPKTKEIQGVVDGTPFETRRFIHTPSLVFVHGMKNIMHSET